MLETLLPNFKTYHPPLLKLYAQAKCTPLCQAGQFKMADKQKSRNFKLMLWIY